MIVFPAIDIQNGRVVRLRQGVAGAGKEYFEDPVEAARKWCDEGALFLHVVDLDGAFAGEPKNKDIIRRICESVEIPVEVGGGIRTEEAIEEYLNNGVSRVILGSRLRKISIFSSRPRGNTLRAWRSPLMRKMMSSRLTAGWTAVIKKSSPLHCFCCLSVFVPLFIRISVVTVC